jgi:hypothetical protein
MHGWDVDDVDTEWDEVFDSDDSGQAAYLVD